MIALLIVPVPPINSIFIVVYCLIGFLLSPAPVAATSVIISLVTIAPFLVVTALGINLAAKHIQAITHVEHGIGIDAVILRIAAPRSIHPALVVALLTQQVVEVQGHDERFVLEERLRQLSVPDEFVGIHRGVVIASATTLMEIAAQLKVPGQAHQELPTIVELPGVKIRSRLKLIA